jgi:hypothetical protein
VTPGGIQTSILRGGVLLRRVELLSEWRARPDYRELVPALVRHTPYPKLWEQCLRRGWYDLRLIDESFVQFRVDGQLSYSFYEAPIRAESFEDFAARLFGDDWEILGEDLRGEYDTYLDSLPRDWPATPIRFDFSPDQYRSPGHPAAHLHFGYSSDLRIATRRILSPEAFILFVIRQFYPLHWEQLIGEFGHEWAARKGRDALELIDDGYWCETDQCEMHLI